MGKRRRIVELLLLPLSYNQGFSMAGILYNGEDGFPRFSAHNGHTCNVRPPPGINQPINICSCSHGLIVFHDPIPNIYYIGNPLYPDAYIPQPQTPRQHDPQHTHVVLAPGILDLPIYQLVCAVEDLTPTTYTFDISISSIGRWISYSTDVEAHIIPNTGVSCNAYAYWLTESPRSIFQCNAYSGSQVWFPNAVISFVPEMRIQLGRIGKAVARLSASVEGSPHFVVKLSREPTAVAHFSIRTTDPDQMLAHTKAYKVQESRC